jgi:CheY-like chemotaxis protein
MVSTHSILSSATILMADNDLDSLSLVEKVLKDHCKEVVVTNDGKKALKIAQSDSPDIVLIAPATNFVNS